MDEQTGKLIIVVLRQRTQSGFGTEANTNKPYLFFGKIARFSLPPPKAANDSTQERDESALTWGLGAGAPAQPAPPQSTLIEIRAGIWEPLKTQPNPLAPNGKQREGRLVNSMVST